MNKNEGNFCFDYPLFPARNIVEKGVEMGYLQSNKCQKRQVETDCRGVIGGVD